MDVALGGRLPQTSSDAARSDLAEEGPIGNARCGVVVNGVNLIIDGGFHAALTAGLLDLFGIKTPRKASGRCVAVEKRP